MRRSKPSGFDARQHRCQKRRLTQIMCPLDTVRTRVSMNVHTSASGCHGHPPPAEPVRSLPTLPTSPRPAPSMSSGQSDTRRQARGVCVRPGLVCRVRVGRLMAKKRAEGCSGPGSGRRQPGTPACGHPRPSRAASLSRHAVECRSPPLLAGASFPGGTGTKVRHRRRMRAPRLRAL